VQNYAGSTSVTNGGSTQWHIVNPDPAGEPPFMAPLRQSSRANSLTLGDNTEAAVKNAATDYFETNFDVEGVIGAGSFGVVYKARSRADNQWYAVKRARKSYGGAMDRRRAHAEIAHFQRVLQPTDRTNAEHCVNLVAAWEQDGYLFLQTELCECGSLQRYLMSRQDALSEELIWYHFPL
jgi:serine/threonine protein kinase